MIDQPYGSFNPVVDFLYTVARDPHVLAIKQTVYRIGQNAPVVEALLEASEQGKEVAVLMELKARFFDEESNIGWARMLERAGVDVVYGLVGLKTHCKTIMVVRQEGEIIRRYMHLSTGNYNVVTSKIYEDIGIFTCDEAMGQRRHRPVQLSDRLFHKTGISKITCCTGQLAAKSGSTDSARNCTCNLWAESTFELQGEFSG
jgi:polyphosphate kinase